MKALLSILALALWAPPSQAQVRTGLDCLESTGFARLEGRRVGLITNHTGQSRDGRGIVSILAAEESIELRAIFSPEHGFTGEIEAARIENTVHGGTGLVIHSLYGATRKPTPEMLVGIDVLVFDIQDIGCRFYTYISTMRLAMEAAAKAGIGFVVLDRPNPLGGKRIAGPLLDEGSESFVGFHTVPVRHGMTAGELALMMNTEREIGCELEVVACEGWERSMEFEATGLEWVNPSPNIRSPNQARLYPGVGLLEFTNLSVGRGTEWPFEVVGAPWIDGTALAAALVAEGLEGVGFASVAFTPDASRWAGEECAGVRISILDPVALDSLAVGMALAAGLRAIHPGEWELERYSRLLGDKAVFEGVSRGLGRRELESLWEEELRSFEERRRPFLLYPGTLGSKETPAPTEESAPRVR